METNWKRMKAYLNKYKSEKYTNWKTIAEMNDKMEDFVREGGCDIYLQLYNKKFPKIVFYAHRVTLVIDIETNTVRTIFSVKKYP